MTKAKLHFSLNGTSVYIVFSTGKESIEFESKEDAISAICGSFEKGKISVEEKECLLKEIALAPNLPDRTETSVQRAFIVGVVCDHGEKLVVNPYVALCDCKKPAPHAYIHDGNGEHISPVFQFKSEGYEHVSALWQQGRITEKDKENLNVLIDLLKLPEDISYN